MGISIILFLKKMFMDILILCTVLILLVPVLIAVAIMTINERKLLAAIQKRLGPNIVGIYGLLQPFADALKLILKENLVPQHVDKALFFLGAIISIVTSLLG
jgi:NADH:ubiquinone oxidoreductase subunit H